MTDSKTTKSENISKIPQKRNKSKISCEELFTEYIAKDNISNMMVNLLNVKCPRSMFLQSTNLVEENVSYQMRYKCCNLVL